jgi:hypothetical protein
MRGTQRESGGRPAAEALYTFPENTVTLRADAESAGPQIHRKVRHIAAVQAGAGLEFRLVEEEFVSNPAGELVRHHGPLEVATDDRALGIVSAGYRRLDEDRLRWRVGPVVARIEADGVTEAERADAVAELDRSVSELDLRATARLHMRVDLIDLLEGRLGVDEFVARTVARQECFAVTQRVALPEQCTESIEV